MIRPLPRPDSGLYLSLQNFAGPDPRFTGRRPYREVTEEDGHEAHGEGDATRHDSAAGGGDGRLCDQDLAARCRRWLRRTRGARPMPHGWSRWRPGRRTCRRWWTQFDDATLTGLVDDALTANLDVRSARTRLREARARRVLAGQDLQPAVDASVSVSASGASDRGGGSRSVASAGLDASWEPDVFGSGRRGVSGVRGRPEAASAADLHATQVSLAAEVALNYVDLRTYQARLDDRAGQPRTPGRDAAAHLVAGPGGPDVRPRRRAVPREPGADARRRCPALETGRGRGGAPARHSARAAARLRCATSWPPPGPSPRRPHAIAVGIPADTLRQRPDVRAAELRLAAAIGAPGTGRGRALSRASGSSGSLGVAGADVGRRGAGRHGHLVAPRRA